METGLLESEKVLLSNWLCMDAITMGAKDYNARDSRPLADLIRKMHQLFHFALC